MKLSIVFGLIVCGFLLFALSMAWGNLFPGTATWTVEKSQRWSQVKDRLHNLAFVVHNPRPRMHAGQDPALAKQEYDELTQESLALGMEFQSANDRPKTVARAMKWTGLSLAVVGIIGWYAINQSR